MSGFDNEVLYCSGERLEPSNAQSILLMQQAPTNIARINFNSNPQGAVAANPSSLSHDVLTGNVYIKQTGTGNTGWTLIMGFQRTATATDYNVLVSDYLISVTSTASLVTINLPDPTSSGMFIGKQFIVKDESLASQTNNITINASGGALIDGAASQVISIDGGSFTFYTNGTDYFII